jgi:hypothetical protein
MGGRQRDAVARAGRERAGAALAGHEDLDHAGGLRSLHASVLVQAGALVRATAFG